MVVMVAITACATDPAPPPSSVLGSTSDATPTEAAGSVPPSAGFGLTPGRPYEASDLVDAMRDSRRPGGVPVELQDEGIAAALADRLWTIGGQPFTDIAAGGSCGPTRCTLELSGSADGSSGEDVWVFAVDPATGSVEVVTADLHAVPANLATALDRLARGLDRDGRLDGLLFTSVRWLPPPDENRFLLAYRSGDEEESCSVDLELDAAAGRITDARQSGC